MSVVGVCSMWGVAPASGALGTGPWSPPVPGPVVRGFDPPATMFGPGHLGVDFAVAPGTAVRAAGDGVVVFAGRVGSGLHVVVSHPGDIRTTDSFLSRVVVVVGENVRRGALLGASGGTGPGHGAGVLHFGVRVGSVSVDPMLLFSPPDLAAVVHLAPPRHDADMNADPGPAAERRALVSELRADATAAGPPPPWWNEPPASSVAPRRVAPAPATRSAPAANGRTRGSDVVVPATGGSIVGASILLVAHRRRRRAGARSAWSGATDLRLHSDPARDSSRPSERGSAHPTGRGSKPT